MKRLLTSVALLWLLAAPAAAQFTSSGVIPLGNFQVGPAGTQVGTPQTGLQGMTALSCQARFAYGSGGTQVNVYIQSSLDQGQSWFDIANIEFTTSSGVDAINLSGLNSVTTPAALTNLALANNTVLNGPLGDRLQATVVSTGTYGGGSLLSVNCEAR
jgi:hypothetical protein